MAMIIWWWLALSPHSEFPGTRCVLPVLLYSICAGIGASKPHNISQVRMWFRKWMDEQKHYIPVTLSQMPASSLTFATPLCWNGPSGHCGWFWMALTRCGCLFIGPGDSTSDTTEAWLAWTRPRQPPSTERLKWRSGGARSTSLLPPWAQSTTTTLSSARWDMLSAVYTNNQGASEKKGCSTYWPTTCSQE